MADAGPQTLKSKISSVKELPEWNFDGSSTDQAPGDNSDVYLRPVAYYPDPFRGGDNIIVMCETYMSDGKPNAYNFRHDAAKVMEAHKSQEFWFGLEQEYTMLDENGWPYGWPAAGFPAPQGPYYCGNGAGKVFGRDIVDAHYKACLYAGIDISGTNAEVMPAQWEFQVGPTPGIAREYPTPLGVPAPFRASPNPRFKGAGAPPIATHVTDMSRSWRSALDRSLPASPCRRDVWRQDHVPSQAYSR